MKKREEEEIQVVGFNGVVVRLTFGPADDGTPTVEMRRVYPDAAALPVKTLRPNSTPRTRYGGSGRW